MNSVSSPKKVLTWTTKQVVFLTVFVVSVFFIFWLLYRLRAAALLLLIAIIIGSAIRPAVEWLHQRGVSRAAGVLLLYILFAAVVAGFIALILPLLADQATQFSQSLPEYYFNMREWLVNSPNRLFQMVGSRIPGSPYLFGQTDTSVVDVLNQVTQTVFYINLFIKGALGTLAVFLLAYYWTQESNRVMRAVYRIVPVHQRKKIDEFLQLAGMKMGGYVRGEGLLALAVGTAALIAYSLIGLPFVLVLAIFAGLMELIPIVGPALGAIPALLVALSLGPDKALWVVAATAIIQMLENAFLVPRIMNNSMGVNPILILLSLVAFSSVMGFAGAVLALPLAALVQLFFDRIILGSEETKENISQSGSGVGVIPLIEENKQIMERIQKASEQESMAFRDVAEADRTEIGNIARELNRLLQNMSNEDETL